MRHLEANPDIVERRRAVRAYTREGLSARQIAIRLRVSTRTVVRDRAADRADRPAAAPAATAHEHYAGGGLRLSGVRIDEDAYRARGMAALTGTGRAAGKEGQPGLFDADPGGAA